MHAQKGQAWIGHWVDQAAHELASLRFQLQVRASKRDDAVTDARPATQRQAVGPSPGAEHGKAGSQLASIVSDDQAPARRLRRMDAATGYHGPVVLSHIVCQGGCDTAEIHNPSARGVQRRHPLRIRFEFGNLVLTEPGQSWNSVRTSTVLELVQGVELLRGTCDNKLPALLRGDAVFVAVSVDRIGALPAEGCFQGTGAVVKAGMDDAAVVARLMCRDLLLPLKDNHGCGRIATLESAGHGQAQDASANHREITRRTGGDGGIRTAHRGALPLIVSRALIFAPGKHARPRADLTGPSPYGGNE